MMCTQALFSHCGAHIPLQMYVYLLFIKLNGNLIYVIIISTLKMLDSYTASFTQQMAHSSFH